MGKSLCRCGGGGGGGAAAAPLAHSYDHDRGEPLLVFGRLSAA